MLAVEGYHVPGGLRRGYGGRVFTGMWVVFSRVRGSVFTGMGDSVFMGTMGVVFSRVCG